MNLNLNPNWNRLAHRTLPRLILLFTCSLPLLVLGLIYGWATFGLGAR